MIAHFYFRLIIICLFNVSAATDAMKTNHDMKKIKFADLADFIINIATTFYRSLLSMLTKYKM